MTGSHSLMIDISNNVFFTYQKYQRLKPPSSDQNSGAGAHQKRMKTNNFFSTNCLVNQFDTSKS